MLTLEQITPRIIWIAALESGKYRQMGGELGSLEGGFCCLGLASHLYECVTNINFPKFKNSEKFKGAFLYEEFDIVRKWLGLTTGGGNYTKDDENNYLLSDDNDIRKFTFKKIAEIIKSEPEGLFIN